MGEIMKASCSECGYEQDDLFIGGGMMDHLTNDSCPHYCESCKIMFVANLKDEKKISFLPKWSFNMKKAACPECGTEDIIPYCDERICKKGEEQTITSNCRIRDRKCLCPSCGNFSLVFDSYALWD